MASDTQARVRGILGELQSLDKARELFSELNYDPSHDLLSRRDWSKAAADALAEDPQIIACHDDFKIIYAHLNSDRLLLGDERPVVNRLLQGHPYVLCLFSDIQQQQWHFVNTKYDEDVKKRRLFRRITVGPDERLRTATERLSQLDLERIRPALTGIYPLDIQQRHDEAFDVEVVTKEFYNTFVELFHQLKDEIASNNPTYRDEAPTEAQMLLNRLMFLYFIQKKRWLDNNPAYLYKKFSEYYGRDPRAHSFYSEFLIRLFQQLSNEQVKFDDLGDIPFLNGGLFEIEPFSSQLPFDLKISNRTFRDVFDRLLEHFNFTVREDTPLDVEVAIDPEMLGRVFENLILQFERERDLRKMTGSYYTPRVIVHFMCQQSLKEYLATESQIDPARLEMLFELNPPDQLEDWEVELLKDIVSVPEARTLRNLAKRAFVLDPAVGSGAFLVSMLHEMLTITKQMDVREHGPEHIARRNYAYELKRNIIENCLYGVDILEQAVRICELRLWLSLAVDYEREAGEEVPPLPNLSYQIKQGDSLIETLFGQRVQLDTLTKTEKGRQLIDEMQQEKHSYFLTRDLKQKRQKKLSILAKQCELAEILVKERRQTLGTSERLFGELSAKEARENEEVRQRVASLDKLLRSAANAKQKAQAWLERKLPATSTDINKQRQELGFSFIWRLDFAEVFKANDGFDIVIGNPPYVNVFKLESSEAKTDKESLRDSYVSARGAFDLYVPFNELSIRISKPGGHVTLISPNKYFSAEYATSLRKWVLENSRIVTVLDASYSNMFDAAVYPVVCSYQKGSPSSEPTDRSPDIISIYQAVQSGGDILITPLTKTTHDVLYKTPYNVWGVLLTKSVHLIDRVLSDAELMSNHCDVVEAASVAEAYEYKRNNLVSDDIPVSNLKVGQHVPFVVSGNIRRYHCTWGTKRTQFLKTSYLKPYLRVDSTIVSDNRRRQIGSQKIIISGMAKRPTAFLDYHRIAASLPAVLVINSDIPLEYLCALLNSTLFHYIYETLFGTLALAGGYLRFGSPQIKRLPLKMGSSGVLGELKSLVAQLQGIYHDHPLPLSPAVVEKANNLDHRIDQLVYTTYGLTPDELTLISETLSKK